MAGVSRWPFLVAAAVALGAARPGRSCPRSSSASARTRSSTASSTGGSCAVLTSTSTTTRRKPTSRPPRSRTRKASYDTLAVQFGHEVAERIPLVVYASHTDFEQTNILPFTPPEGLLGATDFLKRRVSLPFRGNFAEFRHTLRHELVHVFQLDLLNEAYYQAPRHSRPDFPLWWTEGMAELWSGGQDARDEMVMRDLTLSGRLPPLRRSPTSPAASCIRSAGEIHRWLADTYGDWRVATMYKELNRHDSFNAALLGVYGRTLDQLSDEFQLAMRRKYYPSVDSLAPLSVLGREVAKLAVKPTFLPDTNGGSGEVLYVSPATGLRHDLQPQPRRRPRPNRRDRRSDRGDGILPSLRLQDGRVPRGAAPLRRPVRRP